MWKNQQHMHDGIRAAVASPNTPKHLRPHLAKRLKNVKASDPFDNTNAVADDDNLAAEQKRGIRVAPKPATIKTEAVAKKVAPKTIAQPAAKPAPAKPMNPFMRRY